MKIENGRKRIISSMQRNWRSWEVLIRDHHEGYISWAEFERNQHLIADNANGKRFMGRGAVRPGEALLAGLLRCARCGKKLRVRYDHTYRYECVGAFNQLAAARCITFGGMRVDRVLAKEVLDRLQPLGVEAALAAIEARGQQRSEKKVHGTGTAEGPAQLAEQAADATLPGASGRILLENRSSRRLRSTQMKITATVVPVRSAPFEMETLDLAAPLVLGGPSPKPSSQRTPRWRGPDSNSRSHRVRTGFGEGAPGNIAVSDLTF